MQSNRSKNRRLHREAFTLIEVMLVLFILMVLASIGVGAVLSYQRQAQKNEASIYVKSLDTPLELYALHHGRFPSTLDALVSNTEGADDSKGSWPYIKGTAVKMDPWGNPYQYLYPGQRNPTGYDLWSLGPDGISDSGDEIGNW